MYTRLSVWRSWFVIDVQWNVTGGNREHNTGCPKSHCAKVRAYCLACDHLIRKISSGMFQKSSSFEEFNGFSEIDVHFFE